jgi:DMSO/TMAO reductase YedYZ heme-binding membrane subunit
MLMTITVERDPATGKAYTRAGWPYLMIWFGVLGGRLIFVWAVQHVGWFGRVVGEFLRHNHIGTGAVTAFFVLMALAMVLVRSIGLGYRVLVRRSSPGVVTTAVADQASSAMASSSGIRLPPTDQ